MGLRKNHLLSDMAAGPDGFGREQNVDRTDNTLLIGDF
jgi:hypothetical protein